MRDMGRRAAYEFGAGPAGRPGPGCPARRRARREELGALAEEYLRRCFFRHARRCYGDGVKEELEDIASDAVEKCLARLDRFQGGRALFTTWVYGFAKNVLRNHHRKRARRDQIWERCGRIRVHVA